MNRWSDDAVKSVLAAEVPHGLEDLWAVVPQGYKVPADALAAIGAANQRAILGGLALIEQQALAMVGSIFGFRPEIFDRIKGLPGIDVVGETAWLAIQGRLDLAQLVDATKDLMTDILAEIGQRMDAPFALVDYLPALQVVVQVVWGTVKTIIEKEKEWRAHEEAMRDAAADCVPPAFSAALDRAYVGGVMRLIGTPVWDDLFLPLVRPYDRHGNLLGFSCCPSTVDRGRVIAPVGSGIGNRIQSSIGGPNPNDLTPLYYGEGPGYGCLPMCPQLPIQRFIIVPGGGRSHMTYDPSSSLPETAGLGVRLWHLLWSSGPFSFAVDGEGIAAAWTEYLMILRDQIGPNAPGFGTFGPVCDDWPDASREAALVWLFSRIGANVEAAGHDGIYTFHDAAPIVAWKKYAELQAALLERPTIAYVDATTCHPAWRSRVAQAQAQLLDHPDAVCQLDVSSIPEAEYRSAVDARRKQKGAQCFAVAGVDVTAGRTISATSGPSLDPLGESSPPMPDFPQFRAVRAPVPEADDGPGAGLLLGLAGVAGVAGLGFLMTRRRRRRR